MGTGVGVTHDAAIDFGHEPRELGLGLFHSCGELFKRRNFGFKGDRSLKNVRSVDLENAAGISFGGGSDFHFFTSALNCLSFWVIDSRAERNRFNASSSAIGSLVAGSGRGQWSVLAFDA